MEKYPRNSRPSQDSLIRRNHSQLQMINSNSKPEISSKLNFSFDKNDKPKNSIISQKSNLNATCIEKNSNFSKNNREIFNLSLSTVNFQKTKTKNELLFKEEVKNHLKHSSSEVLKNSYFSQNHQFFEGKVGNFNQFNLNKCFRCNREVTKDKFKNYKCKIHNFCVDCITSYDKKHFECINCSEYFSEQYQTKINTKLVPFNSNKGQDNLIFQSKKLDLTKTNTSQNPVDLLSRVVMKKTTKVSKPFQLALPNPVNNLMNIGKTRESPLSSLRKKKSRISSRKSSAKSVLIEESIKCNYCQKFQNSIGFLCNHNICIRCLVFTCCLQISEFFKQYAGRRDIFDFRFYYLCPVQQCGKKISVPTAMIIQYLKAFIQERDANFNQFSDWKDHLSEWIPFLDGLHPLVYN